ncbi:chemosensory receptor C [Elysia marginata]|uniref:Chemosensory receptor C n=1 Tax=Elysia marginata TaxID=1093978 RepID=A0AAV4F546_9GAST|nr:chemosensory receptor C [Elysia marginata]
MALPDNGSLFEGTTIFPNTSRGNDSVCMFSSVERDYFAQTQVYIMVTQSCICSLLSVWSILSGVVNSIAFCKMGLSDGVNQNFLIISVADTLQGVLALVHNVYYIFSSFDSGFKTASFSVLHVLMSVAFSFVMGVSAITTTVVAVVRCCCVTRPFTVQDTFTARRQLAAILCLCGAYSGTLLYIVAKIRLDQCWFFTEVMDSVLNITRVGLLFVCFIIILVSMIVLTRALWKSSQFQRHAAVRGSNIFATSIYRIPEDTLAASATSENKETKNTRYKPATSGESVSRNTRVIRGIFLVLAIFTVCNFLVIFVAVVRLIQPEFNSRGKLRYQYLYLSFLRNIFLLINTNVNIVVYYCNNRRFKKVVNGIFHRDVQE